MQEQSVLTVLIEFRDRVYAKFDEYDVRWVENDQRWVDSDRRLARMDDRITGLDSRLNVVATELHEFRVETNARLDRLEGKRRRR